MSEKNLLAIIGAYKSKILKPLQDSGEVSDEAASKLEAGLYDILSEKDPVLSMPIEEAFSKDPQVYIRALCALERLSAKTLGDVVALTEEEIVEFRNVGKRTVDYIRKELQNYNLDLRTKHVKGIPISQAFTKKSFLYANVLWMAHKLRIKTLNQLTNFTEDELLHTRGVGKKTIRYIKEELARHSRALQDYTSPKT